MYIGGRGVSKDLRKTAYWYTKSAEQGYAASQYFIGYMYIIGEGVSKNYTKAAYWIKKAYENGQPDAEELWNKYELWKYDN